MSENQIKPDNNNLPIKILYVVTQSEWGGAQTYVFDLAHYFSHMGYEVAVACGEDKDGELIKRMRRTAIKVYYLKHLKRKINLWHDWLAFFELIKLMRKTRPQVVHLNSSKAGAIGAVSARLSGVKKIVYTAHGLVLNEALGQGKRIFYLAAEKFSALFKDNIICVSEFDKQSLIENRIGNKKKIRVIYNGIDLKNLIFLEKIEARKRLFEICDIQANEKRPLVGAIANLYANKGLVYLIEAGREIVKLKPDIIFLIIGEGEERKKLQKLITDYKLNDNFYLPGSIARAKQFLKAFDLFVLPSIKEGLSYSLIEAQAAGISVVATDVGGNAEIIEHNKIGILVPAKDFDKLAMEIINLMQNENKRAEFTKNGLENIKKFDVHRMIKETLEVYAGKR